MSIDCTHPECRDVYECSRGIEADLLNEMRIELVVQVHNLCSQIENTTYAFRGDAEAVRQAEGAVKHAQAAIAPHNYNGPLRRTCHNARLIAAAPELLEALRQCVEWMDADNGPTEQALDAIRKATE